MTLRTFNQPSGEVGLTDPSTFNGYTVLKEMGLAEGGPLQDSLSGSASTLQTLKGETHPEIFSANLFALAQQLEGRQDDEAARRLYHGLQLWNPESNWGRLASRRHEVLSGQGNLSDKMERVLRGLPSAVADPASLGSMFAALRVFRGVSWGLMSYMGGTAWTHKAIATLGAFWCEVPAFVLSHRALRSQFMGSHPTQGLPIQDELLHAAITLGALKAFGLTGAHTVAALGQKGITHRFLPQGTMLLGVLGAQAVETKAGLRKFQGTESFLVDGVATWLHFNIAGKILGPLLPTNPMTPIQRPRAPLISPAWTLATPSGVSPLFTPHSKPFGKRPAGLFSQVFSEGRPASSPPPPQKEGGESEGTSRSSGVMPTGTGLAFDSMRTSFGEFQATIQKILFDVIPSENWVEELKPINAQMMREIQTLGELLREGEPGSPQLATIREFQKNLQVIDRGLKELDYGLVTVAPEQIKTFLKHYYRFPNLLVNFINGNVSLQEALHPLAIAQGQMEYILETEKIPSLPLLGDEQTLLYRREIQRVGTEINKLCFYEVDPQWHFKASVALKEFSALLDQVRLQSEVNGQSTFLLQQIKGLRGEVGGIVSGLDRLVTTPSRHPPTLDPLRVIRGLYQIPDSFADFMLDTDVTLLIKAREYSRRANHSLSSPE